MRNVNHDGGCVAVPVELSPRLHEALAWRPFPDAYERSGTGHLRPMPPPPEPRPSEEIRMRAADPPPPPTPVRGVLIWR